jgi:hypothetical protein
MPLSPFWATPSTPSVREVVSSMEAPPPEKKGAKKDKKDKEPEPPARWAGVCASMQRDRSNSVRSQ